MYTLFMLNVYSKLVDSKYHEKANSKASNLSRNIHNNRVDDDHFQLCCRPLFRLELSA